MVVVLVIAVYMFNLRQGFDRRLDGARCDVNMALACGAEVPELSRGDISQFLRSLIWV